MNITFQKLIDMYIEGSVVGCSGTLSNPGTLKIAGNQLIHYKTPIVERYGEKYIVNNTRYSLQTGLLQKKIKASIPEDSRIDVIGVPSDVSASLVNYLE